MKRRTVLKGLAASSALGSAAAGRVAGAREESEQFRAMKRAADQFSTEHTIQRALDVHGEPVQQTMAEAGVETGLDVNSFDAVRSFHDSDDGTPTAHIVAERDVERGSVEVHVLPQADRAFAIERTDAGVRLFDDTGVVEPQGCDTVTFCDECCLHEVPTQNCDPNCEAADEVTQECCTFPDGTLSCETLSRICTDACAFCG